MALEIVVEDGTGLSSANSYVSIADVRAWAAMRGVVLPQADDDLIPSMVKAMDFLESKAADYIGSKKTDTQALSWPRVEVTQAAPASLSYSWDIDSIYNVQVVTTDLRVPTGVKQAQMAATLASVGGVDLLPITSGKFSTVEKLGPLETHFSEKLSFVEPNLPQVDALLEPYLADGGMSVTVRRA